MVFRLGRAAAFYALLACAASLSPISALAAPRSVVPARRAPAAASASLQPGSIESAIASADGEILRRILTVDFDRDGDLDLLASTDRGVLLWLNDGRGNLIVQAPRSQPAIVGGTEVAAWHDSLADSSESIQNNLPSLRVPAAQAHAPPTALRGPCCPPSTSALRELNSNSLVARAPPI